MPNTQQNFILDVPFSEKDQAKKLGAWWDPELKTWFVPAGKDLSPFKKWFPKDASERRPSSQQRELSLQH